LAIISHLFWGLTNIGEKYLVDKQFKNPHVYLLLGFFSGVVSLLILPFVDFVFPEWQVLFWLFLASFGFFCGCFFYIRSIQIEEISRLNVLWTFVPVFAFFGAWIFIGECLNLIEFLAFITLICGSLLASIHSKGLGLYKFSPAFLLMVVGCLFFASSDVINRFLMNGGLNFSSAFVWNAVFLILISLVTLVASKKIRVDFKAERGHYLTLKVLGIVLAVNVISRIGTLFNLKAISLGPIALVDTMEGFQVLFVFVVATLLTLWAPKIIKEEIDKKNILIKLCSFVFMIIGVLILAFARH